MQHQKLVSVNCQESRPWAAEMSLQTLIMMCILHTLGKAGCILMYAGVHTWYNSPGFLWAHDAPKENFF